MFAHVFLASLALLAPQQSVRAPQQAGLVAALPGDAVFVLAVEDFAALWEQAQHSSWGKLAAEPVLGPMWSQLDELVESELGEGLTTKAAAGALRGGAFFVGAQGPDEEEALGLVLRLRPGFQALAYALRQKMERTGEPLEYGGRSMLVGRGGNAGSWEVFLPWSEGIVAVQTGGRESALQLALTLARRLEANTSDGVLRARLSGKRPADGATLEAYLDVGSLLAATLSPHSQRDIATYNALRLSDFGWGTLHCALGRGSDFDVVATQELPNAALWTMLATHAQPVPTRLARSAPAETIEVAALGYDVRAAWDGVKEWLALELPDSHQELKRNLQALSSTTGIDIEHQLLGQLSGEFGTLLLPLQGDERDALPGFAVSVLLGLLGPPGSAAADVYVLGIEDVQIVERLVEQLIEQTDAAGSVHVEDVAGYTLHSFDVPELQLAPSWAFAEGTLLLSTHRSAVRAALHQAARAPSRGWLNEDRQETLLAGGTVFGSSLADLRALAQVQFAAPIATILAIAGERPPRSDDDDSSAELKTIADALPGLIERNVSGTARTTVSVEGGSLRYHFWSH